MIADGDRLLRPSSDWVPQHRECSDNSLCRCLAGYRPAGRAHELLIAAARTAPPISPRVSAARFEEVVALNNLGKACARQAGLRVKGHRDFPVGGQLISLRVDRLCPC